MLLSFFYYMHSFYGNCSPSQGFVEVAIKRLEQILLEKVQHLASRELLTFYSDSKIQINFDNGTFSKKKEYLKEGDKVFRKDGVWQVSRFLYDGMDRVEKGEDLEVNAIYKVKPRGGNQARTFQLKRKNKGAEPEFYYFESLDDDAPDVVSGLSFDKLPPIYFLCPGDSKTRGPNAASHVVFECKTRGVQERESVEGKEECMLDMSKSHVLIAAG